MKIRLRTYILSVAAAFLAAGCIDKTYFGESTQANITTFTIEGQMTNKIEPLVDWHDVGTVEITVPQTFDLAGLQVTDAVCSQLAHFEGGDPMRLTDFSQPVELWVAAEQSGVRKKWIITVTRQKVEPVQIPFSSFKKWVPAYDLNGKMIEIKGQPGYWPGDGKTTSVWQTSIEGNVTAATLGGSGFSVVPFPTPSTAQALSADYARIQTLFAGGAAQTMGTGMAAGGLFNGIFVLDTKYVLAEKAPRKMMNVGTPFYSKPKAVRFDVRYKGGDKVVDGFLKSTTFPAADSCDVMIALQNRSAVPGKWVRVATASLRAPKIGSFADDAGFERYQMDFVYGKPSAAQLAEKPYQQIGGSNGELFFYTFAKVDGKWKPSDNPIEEVYADDPAAVDVDYIMVMFSSSAYGDVFRAAIGSMLDVRNLELIYE